MEYLTHCTRCPDSVHCCKNIRELGFVSVSVEEARKIKELTGQAFNEFLDFGPLPRETIRACTEDNKGSEGELRMAQMDGGRILRLKTAPTGDCIFLKGRKCTIYGGRPGICRIYPFWYRQKNGEMDVTLYERPSDCSVSKASEEKPPLSFQEKEEILSQARLLEAQRNLPKAVVRQFVEENRISCL